MNKVEKKFRIFRNKEGKIFKMNISAVITQFMVDNFYTRTYKHIQRVDKNLETLATRYPENADKIRARIGKHDQSKFSKEELIPYIWITEFYRCKQNGIPFVYPIKIKDLTYKASHHHVTSNRHHPEFHDDPSSMLFVDMAEMVADWWAMSQELGTSCEEWIENVAYQKWKFADHQKVTIKLFCLVLEGKK